MDIRAIRSACLVAALLLTSTPLLPHGGRFDSLGCHHDRKRGGYHCHRRPLAGQYFASKAEALRALRRVQSTASTTWPGLYSSEGRYREAEPLYQRSLAILERVLGPEHPNVATSLNNYAQLLRKKGQNAEAASMEARARAILEKRAR